MMPAPALERNDKMAYWLIGIVSAIVFGAVVLLKQGTVHMDLGFDAHIFAHINAAVNTVVSILLVIGYVLVMQKSYTAHRNVMLAAIACSVLFLVSYIAHHLFAGETKFGGVGAIRYIYFFILITHIILAAVILPFILYTSYQSLSGQYAKHKKVARITFPIWLYVSVTGVVVYLLISPYYS